jgi:dsDNA-specific endonuclease/ATPase MutS2
MKEEKPERNGLRGIGSQKSPVEIPINGEIDLHYFAPRDVADIVVTYLSECRAGGILQVRIVHGKGTGILRARVHAVLKKLPMVESFGLAGGNAGGWGATIVRLRAGP